MPPLCASAGLMLLLCRLAARAPLSIDFALRGLASAPEFPANDPPPSLRRRLGSGGRAVVAAGSRWKDVERLYRRLKNRLGERRAIGSFEEQQRCG